MVKKQNKFIKNYKSLSLLLFNTLILFIVLNLILYGVISIRDFTNGSESYGDDILKEIYPDKTILEAKELIKEIADQELIYYPYVQFKQKPYSGKYINVDENGYRLVENQCEFPINLSKYNIFIFGGSTIFGYGVEDSETIPSQLQNELRNQCNPIVCVYNFGGGYYYSSQERIIFEMLLLEGQVPDKAIFIDGLNDFIHITDEPQLTSRLTDLTSKNYLKYFKDLPLSRTVSYFLRQIKEDKISNENAINNIVLRLENNRKLISSISNKFDVSINFVIQPIPHYNYDLQYHAIVKGNYDSLPGNYDHYLIGYLALQQTYDKLTNKEKEEIIWLANLQENKKENLYSDNVHYNAKFSKEIAFEIAKEIKSEVCII